jgi:hypothetical protein
MRLLILLLLLLNAAIAMLGVLLSKNRLVSLVDTCLLRLGLLVLEILGARLTNFAVIASC